MARLKDLPLPKKRTKMKKALGFKKSSPKKLLDTKGAPKKKSSSTGTKKPISQSRARRTRRVK